MEVWVGDGVGIGVGVIGVGNFLRFLANFGRDAIVLKLEIPAFCLMMIHMGVGLVKVSYS